jgi:hypothetical protein
MNANLRKLLMILGAIVIVLSSYMLTLKLLDSWTFLDGTAQTVSPLHEPSYDASKLPHLKPGQVLDFTSSGSQGALLSGWSGLEPQGVWSDGHSSFLGFIVDDGTENSVLLQAEIWLVPGKLDVQHVQVWSGGKELGMYTLKTGQAGLKIPLSPLSLQKGSPVILGFYLPDAKSPHALVGSPDTRVVSIRIQSLELRQ